MTEGDVEDIVGLGLHIRWFNYLFTDNLCSLYYIMDELKRDEIMFKMVQGS